MDISALLRSLEMQRYAQTFRENGIDLSVLPDLTDQDLEKLGVLLGHRRKLLRAIADLEAIEKSGTGSRRCGCGTCRAAPAGHCRAPSAHDHVLRPRGLDRALGSARPRGHARDHRRLPPLLRRSHHQSLAASSPGTWATGYWPISAIRKPTSMTPNAPSGPGLHWSRRCRSSRPPPAFPCRCASASPPGLSWSATSSATERAQEQAVVGETPNLAARLQALAEPGAVVISSSTRRLTGGLFDYRDLGTVVLKGFAETVQAWQVLGASAAESRFEALRASTTPLVGRGEEIDLLLRRWEQAKGGEGSRRPALGRARHRQVADRRDRPRAPERRAAHAPAPISARPTTKTRRSTRASRSSNGRPDSGATTRTSNGSTKLEAVLALAAQ